MKQAGSKTSLERGEMVTVAVTGVVNASGNALPSMFIFTVKLFRDNFFSDGHTGCFEVGNKSGWQTQETFVTFMKHFVSHIHLYPENLILLNIDNRSSHMSCEVLNLCKKTGIILLPFSPQCSHHPQSLDVSVLHSFKVRCETKISSWL
jgi:hypothetical protein